MRYITEIGDQSENWLVIDTANNNATVGVHESATLAALDAFKRERDSCQEDLLTLMQRQEDLLRQVQHKFAA